MCGKRMWARKRAVPPDSRLDLDLRQAVQRTTLRPFASPRRCGRGRPKPGAVASDERAPLVVRERLERVPFDRRALVDVAAEHELRACVREGRRTASRCLSGNFREARHGAPARWWWQTTMRSAPAGAPASASRGRRRRVGVQPAALVPPGTGRVEPADDGVLACGGPDRSSRRPPRRPPRAASTRAASVYGMSWLPGTASVGAGSRSRSAFASSSSARRPRFARSPLAITSSGRSS